MLTFLDYDALFVLFFLSVVYPEFKVDDTRFSLALGDENEFWYFLSELFYFAFLYWIWCIFYTWLILGELGVIDDLLFWYIR